MHQVGHISKESIFNAAASTGSKREGEARLSVLSSRDAEVLVLGGQGVLVAVLVAQQTLVGGDVVPCAWGEIDQSRCRTSSLSSEASRAEERTFSPYLFLTTRI